MTIQSKEFALPRGILAKAEMAVFDLFKDQSNTRLLYHNYGFAAKLVEYIEEIAADHSISEQGLEITLLAGWFYATGFASNYANPTEGSLEKAMRFLQSQEYSLAKTEKIKDLIRLIEAKKTPVTLEQELFHDAVYALKYGPDFLEKTALWHLEQELFQKISLPKDQWTQLQLQHLLNTKFYTPYGKLNFEPALAKNILALKELIQKRKRKRNSFVEENQNIFQNIGDRIPDRGIQTFFRTNYRNHINLSAIADNKANIMISVNAILLSVLISLLTYKNITETNPMILMSVIIFFITGLTSLVFAILSARPKVTTLNKEVKDQVHIQKNIVFFGNFVHLDLDQYEEALDAVFRDGELLYGNMARDLYYLGKVLDKKYRYLSISYNIFMVGFVATAITLLIALLL